MRRSFTGRLLVVMSLIAGCAPRALPPPAPVAAPAAEAYPDYLHPDIPTALAASEAAARTERGWQYLQRDEPEQAQQEFEAALRSNPGFHPALAGRGYLALSRQRYDQALESFQGALDRDRRYPPALVGRGQTLLALNREEEALEAFERALAADPSLTQLRSRVDVLRFRRIQASIARARTAAADGDTDQARREYRSAIETSPESAFLHRELAEVERRAGDLDAALAGFRRATELDPSDAAAFTAIGVLLEARGDLEGARAAFGRANALDPAPDVAARLAALDASLRAAELPVEVRAITEAPEITRAQLAALVAARFGDVLTAAPARQTVLTDTRGHTAEASIQAVTSAGVLEPFENHAFQPDAAVKRVDLADVVRRLAVLADPARPELDLPPGRRPAITDVNASHLSYPAVSFAVASSVMPLLEGSRFDVARPVSGGEATEVLARLHDLVADGR